jgi:hypothetical protein
MTDARSECETLMQALVPFAEDMLVKHGGFIPFGGVVDKTGSVVHVAAHDGGEQPPPLELIKRHRDIFRKGGKEGNFRATCLVCDVHMTRPDSGEETDAIHVFLDHRDGFSIEVVFPYRLDGIELDVSEPFAQDGENNIFTA